MLVLTAMVLACQPNEQEKRDEQEDSQELVLPTSTGEIDSIVAEIRNGQDTMQERGPLSVDRGDETWEVYAYYAGQEPKVLRALYSGGEQVYYFIDRRVVQLQEFANLKNGDVEERVFSYNEEDLVGAKARRAASRLGLEQKEFGRYRSPYGKNDFRTDVNQVNGSAMSFIYGQ